MIETLPRREREVFETLCGLGEGATAAVRDALRDPLSDSAVRTLLKRLEAKDLVLRDAQGVWRPAPRSRALADNALQRMVDTFFAGSAASAANSGHSAAPKSAGPRPVPRPVPAAPCQAGP